MSGNEQRFIQQAFDTNWIVPLDPNVDGFELDLMMFLDNQGITGQTRNDSGRCHVAGGDLAALSFNGNKIITTSGIGCGQMEVLPQRVEQRRKNNQYYRKHLSNIEVLTFQTEPSTDFYSNYWLTTVIIDPKKNNGVTREDLRMILEDANIESRPLWKPMHLQPVFSSCPYYGEKVSESLFNNGLCLPSGSSLTENDLERVVEVFKLKTKN